MIPTPEQVNEIRERVGRCEMCGDLIPLSEVDSVRGHCRPEQDEGGEWVPTHCGPVFCDPVQTLIDRTHLLALIDSLAMRARTWEDEQEEASDWLTEPYKIAHALAEFAPEAKP